MTGLTYDAGAFFAAERADRRVWALHRRALERGTPPTVPSPVVVEVWRGGAQTARLLDGCVVEPLTERGAKAAGLLLGACRLDVGATDAVLVEGALRRGDSVVTGNRSHLAALAAGRSARLDTIDI